MREKTVRRANLKRIRRDRMRPLRVLECLDQSAVFENSPVEVKEGYVISDRDNGELFLTLNLRSVSKSPIESLDIRVILYRDRQILPYQKIDFRYSWEEATLGERVLNGRARKERECRKEKKLECGEEFGEGIYIPLPESYFKKMQIELVGVTYWNGTYEELGLIAGGKALRFLELDDELRDAYRRVNIFSEAEKEHPIRVLPQEGSNVWLCCCGRKNPSGMAICEACGRDKEWQFENLSAERLEQNRAQNGSVEERRVLHDMSAYKQNKYMESEEELKQKVEKCNEALQRLAVMEKQRERRQIMLLPRIALFFVAIAVLLLLLDLFISFLQNYGYMDFDVQPMR